MIVVVASTYDARAQNVVAHWGSGCATMLSLEDLCSPGWVLSVPHSTASQTTVAGGRVAPTSEISGVLTLRPCVFQEELSKFRREDRPYVAAELNAFLLAWLTSLRCPVLNRATACCLAGPNWRPEQWHNAAHQLGMASGPEAGETTAVTLAGGEYFGDPSYQRNTVALAHASCVELLTVRYGAKDGTFVSANCWPPLTDPAVLDAVRMRLREAI
jgi:hypothetical protein